MDMRIFMETDVPDIPEKPACEKKLKIFSEAEIVFGAFNQLSEKDKPQMFLKMKKAVDQFKLMQQEN